MLVSRLVKKRAWNFSQKDVRNMNMEMHKEVSRTLIESELSSGTTEERLAWFHHMQETQPIRYRPEQNRWDVFRYKDVQQVLADYATFSAEHSVSKDFPGALGRFDPPRHRQLRGLVSKAFTPRSVEELTPRLIQITDELLERAKEKGKINVVTDFADPLPVRIISEMLGVPLTDQEHLLRWSYQLVDLALDFSNFDYSEPLQYFSDLLQERKLDPRDDLMSRLLAAEENGTHLTREEILHMCLELITAGHVTTTMLLTGALYRFSRHPEVYQTLRDDPSLIPGAIEEMLRYDFSFSNQRRTARHDTVLDGHEIKAGETVMAWTSAANFDETYFPQSSHFDIRRSPNPHLSFGHGVHVCLGAPLTRLESRIALERIVTHFSDIRPDLERPLQFLGKIASNGPQSFSIILDAVSVP
jgi:cytochrome P450 family 109